MACAAALFGHDLKPGETLSADAFTRTFHVAEILGDSLPAGRYWFSAQLDFLGEPADRRQSGHIDIGIEIPAGSAELAITPDPLPSERLVGSIRYRLDPAEVGAAGVTRLTLSATNIGTQPVLLVGQGAGCNIYLYGYADATRPGWYLSYPPDWFDNCPLNMQPTWVEAGETRTFPMVVGPAANAPPGRLTLVLEAFILQDPGPDTLSRWRVLLAAGEGSPGG
jgi:hypothetical protein